MKKLETKGQLILFSLAGLGVNMLNLMMGSYICSALLVGGFKENVEFWTFANKDLVVAGLWGVLAIIAKIIDGVIDIPFASFTDNLRTRWGKRRPAIVLGMIPMLIVYVLMLFPPAQSATVGNTIYLAVMLALFYSFYTLTMVTYYAVFPEITKNDVDRDFLSNMKSIFDVVYFVIGFAVVPIFVNGGMNIKKVALYFAPLALTMLIALFMIKEKPTNDPESLAQEKVKSVNLFESLKYSFKNRPFILWMCVACMMCFSQTIFTSGINEFFSTMELNQTIVMACAFGPVPFTIFIYNALTKKKGFGVAIRYVLLMFSLGMGLMFFISLFPNAITGGLRLALIACCSIIVSLAIGSFFSVSYSIPANLAAKETEETGICRSSMYFAVQGLFEAVAAAIASYGLLVFLKQIQRADLIPLCSCIACLIAFALTFILPRSILDSGKKEDAVETPAE